MKQKTVKEKRNMYSFRPLGPRVKSSVLILWLLSLTTLGQTQVKPGFNLFSEKQDIEIGRQSAAEVERQLPVLKDKTVGSYVNRIGKRLAAVAPGADYPYQFKVLNLSDFNAFALPGGFMYVNRGLIEAAGDEAELAGVMAHEIAHVALRHGTNQVSKAYLAQAGLGALGGILGKGQTSDIVGAVGGFGLNSLFLKYSRNAEEQADIVATQMLAKAGYDPMAMARMFERLREQAGRDPGRFEQFFSSHPAPANRSRRVQQEADAVGPVQKRAPVDDFSKIQARLKRMSPAPSMSQVAQQNARR
jgi:beta-barrel assembly-enhancing protease